MSERVVPGGAGSVPRGPEVHVDEVGEGGPGAGSGAPVAEGEVVSVGAEARSPQGIDPDPSDRSTKAAFRRFCRQRRAEQIAEVAEGRAARCQVPEFRHDEGGRQPERFVKLRLIQGGGDKAAHLGLEGGGAHEESTVLGSGVGRVQQHWAGSINNVDIKHIDKTDKENLYWPEPEEREALVTEGFILMRRADYLTLADILARLRARVRLFD
jgi:hypothetical protein